MNNRARVASVLAAAVVMGASPATASEPAPRSAAAPCYMEQIVLGTLHVELTMAKKMYRPGEKVKLDVVVTRPAERDPAGLGIPLERPMTEPAEGIDVGAGINIGDVFVYDITTSDAEGKGQLSVKLPRYAPRGEALVDVLARKVQARTTCAELVEMGYRQFPEAFSVKR